MDSKRKERRPDITFAPVGEDKPAEAIYQQIRQKIIEGEIEIGTRLPSERRMMELFGKSRSTVREALRLLGQDGYITTVSRSSGAIVTEPGVEQVADSLESMIQMQNLDIADITEFRRMTESSVSRLAAERRTAQQMQDIRNCLEQCEASIGDAERFARADVAFHMAIYQAAQNEVYCLMLQVCRQVIGDRLEETLKRGDPAEITARYDGILQIHQRICRAIEEQDGETACREMEQHLISAEKDVLR